MKIPHFRADVAVLEPDVAVLEPEILIHKILCNLVGPVRLRYWNGVFGT